MMEPLKQQTRHVINLFLSKAKFISKYYRIAILDKLCEPATKKCDYAIDLCREILLVPAIKQHPLTELRLRAGSTVSG